MRRLYLVDSSIYVFKAWFSLPDTLCNRLGQQNNAWLGFTDFAYQFLKIEKPRQLVFAFDESLKHSARKEIYPEYKANRSPAPEELVRQFRWCRDWVSALGYTEVASDRHEADDLIGTLTELHRSDDCAITILTADKDLAQLIRQHDTWWSFATGQQLTYRGLIKKFGVKPEQIADQLALAGDKVDNIPGIPGIGMTIAGRLLCKFGSLDNLRANLDDVNKMKFRGSDRIMNLLKEHEAILDISAQLTPTDNQVAAMNDVPITRSSPNQEKLLSMMDEQGMDSSRRQKWLALTGLES